MKLDREKLRQSWTEAKHAFMVWLVPLAPGFMAGFKPGDGKDEVTVFPNLDTIEALFVAAGCAAALALIKGAWWYLTGTKVQTTTTTARGVR